jgi:hypothetical protein
MFEASTDQLRQAVESRHGGKATFVQSVPVYESFKWQAIGDYALHNRLNFAATHFLAIQIRARQSSRPNSMNPAVMY